MKLILKLYASLGEYLPDETTDNTLELDIPATTTVSEIIERFKVPRELAHLVLINGIYIKPDERDQHTFCEGDTLAIWPPVAGG